MAKRGETTRETEKLSVEAERWRHSYRAWQEAMAERDQAVARAERQVIRATAGLGLRGFELACGRAEPPAGAAGSTLAWALQARPEIRASVAHLDQIREQGASLVLAARRELARRSEELLSSGARTDWVVGLDPAELRRFAFSGTDGAPSS